MADVKYLKTEIKQTLQSNRRNPRPAVIPPFSFVGELEVGISGFWYPTSRMELTAASFSASTPGIATASLSILIEEPATDSPLSVADFYLQASETKVIKTIDNVVVTPYDKVYVASWVESSHQGVVVQLVGNLMN